MKKVVSFLKAITVEDFAIAIILGMVIIMTAMGIIFLPAALVTGEYDAAVMCGVDIFGAVFFFWIPWYLDRDERK